MCTLNASSVSANIYIYIHIHRYVYTDLDVCILIHTHLYASAQQNPANKIQLTLSSYMFYRHIHTNNVYSFTELFTHVHIHTYIHIYVYIYMYIMYIHIYICIRTHVHTYAYMQRYLQGGVQAVCDRHKCTNMCLICSRCVSGGSPGVPPRGRRCSGYVFAVFGGCLKLAFKEIGM